MNNVTINNTKIAPVEYNDQRVITTAQLAQAYGCSSHSITKNYSDNKERFIEGQHYFKLAGDDLKEFKNRVTESDLVGKNANQIILWTRRGASRHCKMLGTDQAWEMFDQLEENYFHPRQSITSVDDMLADPDAAIKILQAYSDEKKNNKVLTAAIAERDDTIALLQPRAELADRLAGHDGLLRVGDAAKILGYQNYGQNNLFKLLYRRKVLIDSGHAYQTYVNRGYFSQIEQPYTDPNTGERKIGTAIRVTQRGLEFLDRLIRNDIEAKEAIDLANELEAN